MKIQKALTASDDRIAKRRGDYLEKQRLPRERQEAEADEREREREMEISRRNADTTMRRERLQKVRRSLPPATTGECSGC